MKRHLAITGSLSVVFAVYFTCSSSMHAAAVPDSNSVVVGKLRLPPGTGSRGVHVIIDSSDGESTNREWVELDDGFGFRCSFSGTLKRLQIATGMATIVHQLNAQELKRLSKKKTVDIGTIDLRKRLQAYRFKLLSDDATTLRIGMWFEEPATDHSGNLPSLGSRQFSEIEAGKQMNWLIPSEFNVAYFLVEEPADERRGRKWKSGKQKRFGPFRFTRLPGEFEIR